MNVAKVLSIFFVTWKLFALESTSKQSPLEVSSEMEMREENYNRMENYSIFLENDKADQLEKANQLENNNDSSYYIGDNSIETGQRAQEGNAFLNPNAYDNHQDKTKIQEFQNTVPIIIANEIKLEHISLDLSQDLEVGWIDEKLNLNSQNIGQMSNQDQATVINEVNTIIMPEPESKSENVIETFIETNVFRSKTQESVFKPKILLITTYLANKYDSGKVSALYLNENEVVELIGGLQKPTATCLDENHNYLYVIESRLNNKGYIYQYETKWSDRRFVLAKNMYNVIYHGINPYDCKVDHLGNLYFVDAALNQISVIGYMDLFSGFLNKHYIMYQRDIINNKLNYPTAIDLDSRNDIYYINSQLDEYSGTLNKADSQTETKNGGLIETYSFHNVSAKGVTYTDNGSVFYSLENGEVWTYNPKDKTHKLYEMSNITDPAGICSCGGYVYLADSAKGIYELKDSMSDNYVDFVFSMEDIHGIFCVSFGVKLFLGINILMNFL
ncbi:unnamed protein product [Blepharisma stoltei]|uniref:Uncharacterized protein n=1 Tax=Blepharisma stoltei TaxID=1481888 RepID=A0AAU9JP27_9CILI|nr:unnamed protein product [Blepharisma stoltei]